jgi:Tfp pilus assembly protein PilN
MINLLPPEKKEELLREKRLRLMTILGISLLFFLVCFSLILFSIKTFVGGEVEAQKILFEQREKELRNPQMQALEENLVSFNLVLSKLESFYHSQTKLNEILEKISEIIPSEIYLTNLSIVPSSEKTSRIKCDLSGFSPTREKLLELKGNLEDEESFEGVSLPPASWVEATDINFIATFRIK